MLLTSLQQSSFLLISTVFILGLLVGSFLNVVIYRLPLMMQRNWRKECQTFLGLSVDDQSETYNLLWPGSQCPTCKVAIKARHNLPVISYLFLGGHCAYCGQRIAIRYPLIELLTAIISLLVAWHF